MEGSEKLCRFCFKILLKESCQKVEMYTRIILDVLHLKLNMNITEDPALCSSCSEDLQKAFEFRSTYMYSKQLVPSLNVEEHFLSEKEDHGKNNSDKEKICYACAKFVTGESQIPLYEIQEYLIFARDILESYFSEMDLNPTNEYIMCRSCLVSLKRYVEFTRKCLETEEKISSYCLMENINGRGHVDLNNVLEFTVKQIVKYENCSSDTDGIKREIGVPDVLMNIKKEDVAETEASGLVDNVQEVNMKMEPWSCASPISSQEILWLKNEPNGNEPEATHNQDIPDQIDDELKTNHKVLSTEVSDIKFFYCDLCTYKTRRKAHLKAHLESHWRKSQKQMFKCHLCIFQAQYKSVLRKHMVVHTDPSQLRMYMCEICSYQTKYKGSLNGHMQKHNQEAYKCEVCGFETKYRKNLERHMVTHKNPAEIPMYKCAICAFEARRKSHLSMHIAVKHRGAEEITKFKCEVCGFEFISKSDLNRHSKTVHKDPSEITMYKCDLCPFQTKYKDHLPRHMIKHKDPSEVVTYKCEFCPFQSKYENGIKGHLLVHVNVSELPVFKCNLCPYETNRRQYLSRHLTAHKKQLQA